MKTIQKTFQDDEDPWQIVCWVDDELKKHIYETTPRDPAERMCYTDKKITVKIMTE